MITVIALILGVCTGALWALARSERDRRLYAAAAASALAVLVIAFAPVVPYLID
jgi:hypothetical protein